MFVVLCLILVIALGILSCLMSIAVDVRAIREAMQSAGNASSDNTAASDATPAASVPAVSADSDDTIVIWEWRDGSWSAVDGAVSAAGDAPTFPGAFEGDRVKKLRA